MHKHHYSPSLIQREPAEMHEIKPTALDEFGARRAPMNTPALLQEVRLIVGGASAFGLTALLNKTSAADRKPKVISSYLGALGGLAHWNCLRCVTQQ